MNKKLLIEQEADIWLCLVEPVRPSLMIKLSIRFNLYIIQTYNIMIIIKKCRQIVQKIGELAKCLMFMRKQGRQYQEGQCFKDLENLIKVGIWCQ